MATNKHIDNLSRLRENLVELRRSHAEHGMKNDPQNAVLNVTDIQKQIEILDRAITDETELLPATVTVKKF